MLRGISSMRQYFTASQRKQRPLFHEVFPQKRTVNRLLFELDSKHTFNKLYPVYESIYNEMQREMDTKIPKSVSPSDLMVMKKVLEKIRHRTKSINPHLLALENALLDKSAELGNNDAIALLAFDVLRDPEHNTTDDVKYGKKLVKELYRRNHHLTFKLLGDLSLKSGNDVEASKYYLKTLQLEDNTYLAGEVYGQLGQINFRKPDLNEAERCFLKAVKLSPLEYSVHSHFYLSQIYMNSNPVKARALMENCATQGFRESFKALGFLEMNYFSNMPKAREWFKLGMELFDIECFVGFFDCSLNLRDLSAANRCYNNMLQFGSVNETYKKIIDEFIKNRHQDIEESQKYSDKPLMDSAAYEKIAKESSIVPKENRWEL
ncbi:related to MSS2-COX2 pre-mRNA splicing factor [Zygosaccharomyces bailii ISA1307]|nr:related to MSS2-COX2 pre-mRNA splicing factor [Zygosaccharomyces bailii ISA1307]